MGILNERLANFTRPQEYMEKVAIANLLATSAISFINPDVLLSVWEQATTLNAIA